MRRSFLALVGVVLLAGSAAVGAHHSYANFSDKITSIEGTLEKVMFANPHVVLTIRTKDASVFTATWVAAFTLENRGMKATELKIGDVVVVMVHQHAIPRCMKSRAWQKCAVSAMDGVG